MTVIARHLHMPSTPNMFPFGQLLRTIVNRLSFVAGYSIL